MGASPGYCAFIVEQMAAFGAVEIRRMFGGAGIFRNGVMFGLIADDTLYLKGDRELAPDFENEGLPPFVYGSKRGRNTVMSYWRAPGACLDDPDEMADWCRRSFAAAMRNQARPRR